MNVSIQKKGRYANHAPMAELPHPKIAPEIFIILHRVLVKSFDILSMESQPLATMHEDPITAHLELVIENRLRQSGEVPGFSFHLFERVTRQHECDNYNGSSRQERPDLFFGLRPDDSFRTRIQSDQYGVFAECKPVDTDHAAGEHYCGKGLTRFVRGDYAWAMQDALMIAYARHGRSIATHLAPAMASKADLSIEESVTQLSQKGCEPGMWHEGLHVSKHGRTFQWINNHGAACSISIYHSWHDCGNRIKSASTR